MITKQLMHDIITFCNNYIDNKNIVISISKCPNALNITFSVWTINNGFMQNCIESVFSYINDIDDFKNFKQKILEKLPKLLEQLKEK